MTMLRRAITVPLATALMIGVLSVWPVLLVVGGVVGLISRSSLPVRTLGVVMAYALLELRALWQLIRGGQDRDEFIRDLLERAHTVGRRTLNVDVRARRCVADSGADSAGGAGDRASRGIADRETPCWWPGCSTSTTGCSCASF